MADFPFAAFAVLCVPVLLAIWALHALLTAPPLPRVEDTPELDVPPEFEQSPFIRRAGAYVLNEEDDR